MAERMEISLGTLPTIISQRVRVVDHGIVSENFFDNIEKFMIFPQSDLSDQCKIATEITNMKDIRSKIILIDGLPITKHLNGLKTQFLSSKRPPINLKLRH